jgi:transcriptional regulator with XRE-family HTH domain
MQTRIRQLLDHLGLSPADFAIKLGVQRSAVSHILSGRNNPGLEFLQKMLITFPEINPDWLLLGKGKIQRAEFSGGVPEMEHQIHEMTGRKESQPGEQNDPSGKLASGIFKNQEDEVGQEVKIKNREPLGSPVEKIIMIFADGTFNIYRPSGDRP